MEAIGRYYLVDLILVGRSGLARYLTVTRTRLASCSHHLQPSTSLSAIPIPLTFSRQEYSANIRVFIDSEREYMIGSTQRGGRDIQDRIDVVRLKIKRNWRLAWGDWLDRCGNPCGRRTTLSSRRHQLPSSDLLNFTAFKSPL